MSESGQRCLANSPKPDDVTTYSAVATTGIYCRPGCGGKPRADNVRTFELAATAEAAGYRACLRCRPYRVSGTLPWQTPELVCRAVQLIIAGALDDGTEAGLGSQLGLSARHLRRLFHQHLGLTPDQFARSRRAHFARRLLDDTDLGLADVAFGSGFGSVRQFNRAMGEIFRATPQELRQRRQRADRLVTDGGLTMRLPFQPPFDWDGMVAFLTDRATPGVESIQDRVYRRTVSLDGSPGVLEIRPGGNDHLLLRAHLPYWEGLIHVVERVGQMVGSDAETDPAVKCLAADPTIGSLVASRPGLRVPGAWSPFEVAVHAVVAQHESLARARTQIGLLVQHVGQPISGLGYGLTHLFPSADAVAGADLEVIDIAPAIAGVVRALAIGVVASDVVLDSTLAQDELVARLTAIPGIGSSAAHQVALRLGHRDAFPESDPQLRSALSALGAPYLSAKLASRWQPWRAVAATHLLSFAGSTTSEESTS
jgi:AraC family transcriptional regulator, regulatory protein of adaptative response / DNA-3-methyladenine glycosylase II